MSEDDICPDDIDAAQLSRAVRFAPWYVAIATWTAMCWLYIVVGEFVLSGLPEWLGWVTVVATTVANYWALERRFLAHMLSNMVWQRIKTLLVVLLFFLLALLLAMFFGSLLPEPVVTVLLLAVVGVLAWWKRVKRRRLYATLPKDLAWRAAARSVVVAVSTLLAMGALVGRQ
jgi:hypothetical protein